MSGRNYVKKSQKRFHDEMLAEGAGRGQTLLDEEPEPFNIINVQCEVCKEHIGKIDIANLVPPLKGSDFFAKNQKNGYPPPFHPSLTWEDLRCPMCRKRPFYQRCSVIDMEGERHGFLHECPVCFKGFKKIEGLNGHIRTHYK
jgi:hypothetical protein